MTRLVVSAPGSAVMAVATMSAWTRRASAELVLHLAEEGAGIGVVAPRSRRCLDGEIASRFGDAEIDAVYDRPSQRHWPSMAATPPSPSFAG